MRQSNIFLLSKDIPAQTVGDGVTRQIMGYNKDIMLVRVEFQAGSIGYIHIHPHLQTSYVVSGRFEVDIDGEKQILSTGDGFFVPSGKSHGVVCIENGILIDSFSPGREDFISNK